MTRIAYPASVMTATRRRFGSLMRLVVGLVLCMPLAAAPAHAQALEGGDWAPAAGAVGDNTYEGFIDSPSNGADIPAGASFQVSGWVVDTSADGWSGIDDVQIMLGNTLLTHAAVGLSRPDVADLTGNPFFATSGFSGVVATPLPSGTQTLTFVAHTPGKGSWSKQVTVNVAGGGAVNAAASGLVLRIISPKSDDVITSNNNGAIFGTAYDTRTRAELGTGVDRVQVYLDGPRGMPGSQALGDATLNGTNWSLSWEPTKYNHVLHHVLYVYARSNVTGEEALVSEEINLSR